MPKFLENKLKREYPNNPRAAYGTMNAMGVMRGSQITPKGVAMEARAPHVDRGNRNVRNVGTHTGKLKHG